MARRPLLTDEERRLFFGIADDPDGLPRQYIFTRSDQDLVAGRRGAANQPGFAVAGVASPSRHGSWRKSRSRLASLSSGWRRSWAFLPPHSPITRLECAHACEHARLVTAWQCRPALHDRAAAQSAWSMDRGAPIVAGVIAALRTARIILPAPAVIERTAIAGRARARKRAAGIPRKLLPAFSSCSWFFARSSCVKGALQVTGRHSSQGLWPAAAAAEPASFWLRLATSASPRMLQAPRPVSTLVRTCPSSTNFSSTKALARRSRHRGPVGPRPALGPRRSRVISPLLLPNISLVLNSSRFPSLIVYALETGSLRRARHHNRIRIRGQARPRTRAARHLTGNAA
jgi:hypothetical protein